MSTEQYWLQIARQKAQTDFQDHPKSFLKGVTNHYSKDVDVYMFEAYQDERMIIIMEQRK